MIEYTPGMLENLFTGNLVNFILITNLSVNYQ